MEREGISGGIRKACRGERCRKFTGNTDSAGGCANGILRAAGRAMEMERIWGQYPEDDAGWMIL